MRTGLKASFLLLSIILTSCYFTVIDFGKTGILYTDFGKFYQSGKFFLEKKNIYTPIYFTDNKTLDQNNQPQTKILPGNLNPPFFTLLTLPLSYLSYANALWIWSLLSCIGVLASVYFLCKSSTTLSRSSNYSAIGLAIIFFAYLPTFSNIHFGQVTLFLLPFVCGAWLAIRQNKPNTAALLLAIAAGIKPYLALFGLYFLINRQWRALFYFCLTGLMTLLLPLFIFGKITFINYFAVIDTIRWAASSWNASLLGVVVRLFGNAHELNTPIISKPYLSYPVYLVLSFLLILVLIKFLKTDFKFNINRKNDFSFCGILITTLLVSPLGWLYYFPLLCVPFIVLWELIGENYYSVFLTTSLTFILIASSLPAPLIASGYIKNALAVPVFIVSNFYTFALMYLLGLFFFLQAKLPIYRKPALQQMPIKTQNLLVVFALIPSLFGIIKTAVNIHDHGSQASHRYKIAYFGN